MLARSRYHHAAKGVTMSDNQPPEGPDFTKGVPGGDIAEGAMLAGRVGGTPVISMNGNQWVGTGHNAALTDFAGQDWLVYHAINRDDPYFADPNPFRINKRHLLIDALDWVDGWPTARAGQWVSATPQHAPAAQPGEDSHYRPNPPQPDLPGDGQRPAGFCGRRGACRSCLLVHGHRDGRAGGPSRGDAAGPGGQGGGLGDQGQVVGFLDRAGGEHGETGLPHRHHVRMVTEDGQALRGQ